MLPKTPGVNSLFVYEKKMFFFLNNLMYLFMVKMMTETGTEIPIMAWVEGIPYSSAHWG